MNRPDIGISDDYAVLKAKNARFYYGYECTADDEWCFEAKFNGQSIIIPQSKLGVKDPWDVVENLLAGIGWVLARYKLGIDDES